MGARRTDRWAGGACGALALCGFLVAAHSRPVAEEDPVRAAGRVGLEVLEAGTGRPVGQASVEVEGASEGALVDLGEGRWEIELGERSGATAIVRAPGLRARRVELDAELLRAVGAERFVVRLAAPGQELLHVVDAQGRAVAQARVRARIGPDREWEPTYAFVRKGDTNEFELAEVEPKPELVLVDSITGASGCIALPHELTSLVGGRLEGWVERAGWVRAPLRVSWQQPRGGAGRASADCGATFWDPRETVLDAVVLERAAGVRGLVRWPDGSLAAGVEVSVSAEDWPEPEITSCIVLPRSPWRHWRTLTDAEGSYRFEDTPWDGDFDSGPASTALPAERALHWFLDGRDQGVLHVPAHVLGAGENRRDWQLQAPPRIRGVIQGGTGIRDLCIIHSDDITGRGKPVSVAADGSFVVERVAWGMYSFGRGGIRLGSAQVSVHVGPEDLELSLVLRSDADDLELVSERRVPRPAGR